MFDVAIICSVIEARKRLLDRSLQTWIWDAAQSGLSVAIRIYSDGFIYPLSGDVAFSKAADVDIIYSHEPSGSHITGYNFWWERTEAKVYLFTHPDLLWPVGTIQNCFEQAQPNTFVSHRIFWLPVPMTQNLDQYPWQTPEKLEQYEELYQLKPDNPNTWWWNRDVRKQIENQSTTTWAMEAETLKRIFPFPDLGHQGYDDLLHQQLRDYLGIQTHTSEVILFHQWHEQSWDQNMQQAIDEADMLLAEYKKAHSR